MRALFFGSSQPTSLCTVALAAMAPLVVAVLAVSGQQISVGSQASAQTLTPPPSAIDARYRRDVARALQPDVDAHFDKAVRARASALRTACAAEDWHACTELGTLYAEGDGTWVDTNLAFAFSVTACFEGVPRGCAQISWNWRVGAASLRYEGDAPYGEVLEKACDSGGAESCWHLSRGLVLGEGDFQRDQERAADLLQHACDLGHANACKALPKAPQDLVARHREDCTAGRQFSCYLFARKLFAGEGIEKDTRRGQSLIEETCAVGVQQACTWLAQTQSLDPARHATLMERGCIATPGQICNEAMRLLEGLPKDDTVHARIETVRLLACSTPEAFCHQTVWEQIAQAAAMVDPFDQAADAQFAPPLQAQARTARLRCAGAAFADCQDLARLYARLGTREGKLRASHILKPFCDQGDPQACLDIAALFQSRPEVQKDLYQNACALGSERACLLQTRHNQELSDAERLEPLQQACSDGDPFACRLQADLLTEKAGRFQKPGEDRARGRALYLFACDQGETEACYQYGYALAQQAQHQVSGQDLFERSLEHLVDACAADHALACFRVGTLYSYDIPQDDLTLERKLHFYGRACRLSGNCEAFASAELEKKRNQMRAAQGILETALMSHEQDFRDHFQARIRRYRRDCAEGDMEHCVALADRYVDKLEVDGIYGLKSTTPRDTAWATALYALACQQNFALGCDRLAEVQD